MSSTGARRFLVLCAEAVLLALPAWTAAQDCPPPPQSPAVLRARLNELHQAAQSAMERHDFAAAVASMREAACLAPGDPGIVYALGTAQAAAGDFLSARKTFQALAAKDSSNPLPLVMLVRVNVALGDIDGAKASLRDAAQRFPRNGELHALLAQFLAQNKLLDLALAESLRAHEADPRPDAQATLELAVLENTVGAYDEAIRNATRILNQPDSAAALRASAAAVAGLSQEGAGHPDAAIPRLEEAIRLDPSQENSYLALAFLFEKTQKFDEAVAVLERARRRFPASTALLLPLGSNLVRTERFAAAIPVLKQLLDHSPADAEAHLRLADAYRKTGEHEKEIAILSDLARRAPDYPRIHVLIAEAMLNQDPVAYAQVLDELSLAEKSSPSDAQVAYLRSKVYEATGRRDDARQALLKAIELAPMDPSPYYRLGRLLLSMGHPKEAQEALDRMRLIQASGIK